MENQYHEITRAELAEMRRAALQIYNVLNKSVHLYVDSEIVDDFEMLRGLLDDNAEMIYTVRTMWRG